MKFDECIQDSRNKLNEKNQMWSNQATEVNFALSAYQEINSLVIAVLEQCNEEDLHIIETISWIQHVGNFHIKFFRILRRSSYNPLQFVKIICTLITIFNINYVSICS